MGIQVRATASGYDGVVLREVDSVFTLSDETVPGPWFEATDVEGAAKLAKNKDKDDYERAKKGALLARRATDKLPAVEALRPAAEPKKSLKEQQADEVKLEQSGASAGVLASDLV